MLSAKAYELGDVTRLYEEACSEKLKPALGMFEIHITYNDKVSDGLGGLIDRVKLKTLAVKRRRDGKVVMQTENYMPRDVWYFLRGVLAGMEN